MPRRNSHPRRAACCLLLALLCLSLASCAGFRRDGDDSRAVAAFSHNPVSLAYYKAGRTYSAQGRFELAKEQYLLAYAAAEGDSSLRASLEQELRAADMMLRTIR